MIKTILLVEYIGKLKVSKLLCNDVYFSLNYEITE